MCFVFFLKFLGSCLVILKTVKHNDLQANFQKMEKSYLSLQMELQRYRPTKVSRGSEGQQPPKRAFLANGRFGDEKCVL